jgi:hypothetical protein
VRDTFQISTARAAISAHTHDRPVPKARLNLVRQARFFARLSPPSSWLWVASCALYELSIVALPWRSGAALWQRQWQRWSRRYERSTQGRRLRAMSSTSSTAVYFATWGSASNLEDDSEALNEDGSGESLQPGKSTSLAISFSDFPLRRCACTISYAVSLSQLRGAAGHVASPWAAFFAALGRGTVLQPWGGGGPTVALTLDVDGSPDIRRSKPRRRRAREATANSISSDVKIQWVRAHDCALQCSPRTP